MIPQELKNKIPENVAEWVGIFVGVAMVLARLKKQPELHEVNQFVTVTAGHSNTDSGAVNGSDRESDIAQDMRNIVAHYLRAKSINIRTDG